MQPTPQMADVADGHLAIPSATEAHRPTRIPSRSTERMPAHDDFFYIFQRFRISGLTFDASTNRDSDHTRGVHLAAFNDTGRLACGKSRRRWHPMLVVASRVD